jgi:hypothetical protein
VFPGFCCFDGDLIEFTFDCLGAACNGAVSDGRAAASIEDPSAAAIQARFVESAVSTQSYYESLVGAAPAILEFALSSFALVGARFNDVDHPPQFS